MSQIATTTLAPCLMSQSSPKKSGLFYKTKNIFALKNMMSLIKTGIKRMKINVKFVQNMMKNNHNMVINNSKIKAK